MAEMQDYSLSARVFQKIREDIIAGKYAEHDELREITIGKELGVSRTPVREALRQLELEGLVTIIPNKGAYVSGITPKDVHDIYCIWRDYAPDGLRNILHRNRSANWKRLFYCRNFIPSRKIR